MYHIIGTYVVDGIDTYQLHNMSYTNRTKMTIFIRRKIKANCSLIMMLVICRRFTITAICLLRIFPPSTNDHNCSSKRQYFGVLYRQLLPRFKNEIPNTPHATHEQLMKIMDDYYPEIE